MSEYVIDQDAIDEHWDYCADATITQGDTFCCPECGHINTDAWDRGIAEENFTKVKCDYCDKSVEVMGRPAGWEWVAKKIDEED